MKFKRGWQSKAEVSLRRALSSCWRVRSIRRADESNAFDPPVNYVEARLFDLTVRVCEDAEVYVDDHGVHHVFTLPPWGSDGEGVGEVEPGVIDPKASLMPEWVGEQVVDRLGALNA